jgi:hypothetical protein
VKLSEKCGHLVVSIVFNDVLWDEFLVSGTLYQTGYFLEFQKKAYIMLDNIYYPVIVWFCVLKRGSSKLQFYLIMDLRKFFWYLVWKVRTPRRFNRFQWCPLRWVYTATVCFTVALCETDTRKTFLGPWLNKTEVYLTPFLVHKITQLQDNISFCLNECTLSFHLLSLYVVSCIPIPWRHEKEVRQRTSHTTSRHSLFFVLP